MKPEQFSDFRLSVRNNLGEALGICGPRSGLDSDG